MSFKDIQGGRLRAVKLLCIMIAAYIILVFPGCKKFVSVDPPTSDLVSGTVFSSDAKATAAMVGIYSQIAESVSAYAPGGTQSFTLLAGLSADELADYSFTSPRAEFYANAITAANTTNLSLWRTTYQYIYRANAVIEGLQNARAVNKATKDQLTGEAKFIRAFFHFYLVNLWGDIPFINSTDYQVNAVGERMPKSTVYKNIVADLLDAQALLTDNYITADRVRPNKWVAKALLARVYLYMQDWANAESTAGEIINRTGTYSLVNDFSKIFIKNSNEAIWQLMAVAPNFNSSEGYNFILMAAPSNIALSSSLVNSFETGDLRKTNWISSFTTGGQTYYFPFKYKVKMASAITEYSTVFRLAEQYLVRAEARAQQNKLTGNGSAVEDINLLRARAGLQPVSVTTQAQLLSTVEQERKVELFTEWGHRWLDLKRTNRAEAIIGTLKPASWQSTDVLYPVPQVEILNDNKLTQNNGY